MNLKIGKKLYIEAALLLTAFLLCTVPVAYHVLTFESSDMKTLMVRRETRNERAEREKTEGWAQNVYASQRSYADSINAAFRYANGQSPAPVSDAEKVLLANYSAVVGPMLEEISGFGTEGIFETYRNHPFAVRRVLPFFKESLTATADTQYNRLEEKIAQLNLYKTMYCSSGNDSFAALNAYDSAVRAYIYKLEELVRGQQINALGGRVYYSRNSWDGTSGYEYRANDSLSQLDGNKYIETLIKQVDFSRRSISTVESAISRAVEPSSGLSS